MSVRTGHPAGRSAEAASCGFLMLLGLQKLFAFGNVLASKPNAVSLPFASALSSLFSNQLCSLETVRATGDRTPGVSQLPRLPPRPLLTHTLPGPDGRGGPPGRAPLCSQP